MNSTNRFCYSFRIRNSSNREEARCKKCWTNSLFRFDKPLFSLSPPHIGLFGSTPPLVRSLHRSFCSWKTKNIISNLWHKIQILFLCTYIPCECVFKWIKPKLEWVALFGHCIKLPIYKLTASINNDRTLFQNVMVLWPRSHNVINVGFVRTGVFVLSVQKYPRLTHAHTSFGRQRPNPKIAISHIYTFIVLPYTRSHTFPQIKYSPLFFLPVQWRSSNA